MDFEGYHEGNSIIHRIDPRVRVLITLVFSFLTAILINFNALFLSLTISLLLVISANLNIIKVSKNLKAFTGFIILIWIILPLSIKGETLYKLWFLNFSTEGIELALRITLKSFSIILLFNALISTMNFSVLGSSMESLKVPLKIVYLFLMTFRYISVLDEEYKRLMQAAKIRGFKAGVNLHTYKTYGNILGMLFVNAHERGNRVYKAMVCRGFNGKFYSLQNFKISFKDFIFASMMVLLISAVLTLEYSGILLKIQKVI
ncbi:MAG: cobalt ECF transporter T component CbiQ [Deltaproteobacteria bacterium]|nr:cobalt ECF transporter T component CbiQ [Deltaproteobacteria bacterium]